MFIPAYWKQEADGVNPIRTTHILRTPPSLQRGQSAHPYEESNLVPSGAIGVDILAPFIRP